MEIAFVMRDSPPACVHFGLHVRQLEEFDARPWTTYTFWYPPSVYGHAGRDTRRPLRAGRIDSKAFIDDRLEVWESLRRRHGYVVIRIERAADFVLQLLVCMLGFQKVVCCTCKSRSDRLSARNSI